MTGPDEARVAVEQVAAEEARRVALEYGLTPQAYEKHGSKHPIQEYIERGITRAIYRLSALTPQPDGEWRAITEHDGSGDAVMLFSPDARAPGVMLGSFTEFANGGPEWTDLWGERQIDADPTHWMPLPAAPLPSEASDGSR